MRKILLSLLCVSNIAWSCPNPSLTEAAVLDTASTMAGLIIHPSAIELNPLGIIGATLGRVFLLINQDKIDLDTQATGSAIWTGAAIHNVVHILGVPFAPSIMLGLIAGLVVKSNNNCLKGN